MRRRLVLGLPLIALLPAMARAGVPAPRLNIQRIQQLSVPLPAPYDRNADAEAQVTAALARARQRRVPLIANFGGNWCVNCRVLAGVLALPEMKPWLAAHFERSMSMSAASTGIWTW